MKGDGRLNGYERMSLNLEMHGIERHADFQDKSVRCENARQTEVVIARHSAPRETSDGEGYIARVKLAPRSLMSCTRLAA